MCGISGAIGLTDAEAVSEQVIRRMSDVMSHRGPDGSGFWRSADGKVGLGHRRLAIVDLSENGRQPMGSSDGALQVTFNGEIYNFRALRRDLESKGYRFRSESDTEVLLYLYAEYGESMVEKLDGDFAFGLWDGRARKVLLARDRAGVKPLYYTIAGGQFLFASEIKALLEHPSVARDVDEESLYHYLTYLVVPAPRTLFKGISKLAPAGTLVVDISGSSPRFREGRFWRPFPGQYAIDPSDLDGQFRDLFTKSVEKRLMSDVPVGVLFSGGVDSTLNAVHFQRLISPARVRTYYVGMSGAAGFDEETAWARQMSKRLETDHHEVIIDERDLLDAAEAITRHQDEPLSDPVCVPLYFVTRLARESGTTVLHAGEGADEIFCGYDNYRKFLNYDRRYWRPLNRLPSAVGTIGHRILRRSSKPHHQKAADFLLRQSNGQNFFLSGAVAYYESEKASILTRGFQERHAGLDSADVVKPLYDEIEHAFPDATFLQKLTYIELQLRLPELLLMRVDKMAMSNSIEVRVPFLDRDLVDFALSVPESFKLRDGVSKEPVKRLAAEAVGRDAIYRRKRGFGAPIQQWFRTELGSHFRDLLREERSEWSHVFDLGAISQRLDRGPETVNQAFQLWVIYNLVNWRRNFRAAPVAAA